MWMVVAPVLASVLLASAPEEIDGEVVLSVPGLCEAFVVHTDRGFSLLTWTGGYYVFTEGDRLRGCLHCDGIQHVRAGAEAVTVRVEDWASNLDGVRRKFYRLCAPD